MGRLSKTRLRSKFDARFSQDIESGELSSTESGATSEPVPSSLDTDAGSLTSFESYTLNQIDADNPDYNPDYPRLSSIMIAQRTYAEDNGFGEYMRTAISLVDNVTIGLYADGPWDNGAVSQYGGTYLTRAEVIQNLKAKNPNLIIMDYTDLMEGGTGGEFGEVMNGTHPDPIYAGSGTAPGGLDWWGYKDADTAIKGDETTMISTYPGSYNRNITHWVFPANNGWKVPQCYAQYSDDNKLAPHSGFAGIGPQGINLYCDVFDIRPRTNSSDFNLDGLRDESRTNYDPLNPAHNSIGASVAQAWREGQRDYILEIKSRYPNIVVTCNATTWAREYLTTEPAMFPEYVNLMEGGIQEGQSLPDDPTESPKYPFSGVASDGTTHPTGAAGFGKWIRAQNSYNYLMKHMIGRKLICNDWWMDFNNLRLTTSPVPGESLVDDSLRGWVTPNRNQLYDAYPSSSNAWNLGRYSLASTLMNNGYHCITGVNAGSFSGSFGVCVHIDEYGTKNQATTGLIKGWMGQPVDAPVLTPNLQGTMYMRRFSHPTRGDALVILNPEWDDTQAAETVLVANLPGGAGAWKHFNGVDDPVMNDGSVVNANFSLNPIDAVFLLENI